jgi:hypothetical protein
VKVGLARWKMFACAGSDSDGLRREQVELTGILRIEFSPARQRHPYCRLRIIFLARPVDPEQLPKGVPNYEVRSWSR